MKYQHYMKPSASGRHGSTQSGQTRCGKFTAMLPFLLSALCLTSVTGCSSIPSAIIMPPPNLATSCPPLPEPARIDPERLIWELWIVSAYNDCATKHRLTIEAWRALDKKPRRGSNQHGGAR